MTWKLLSAAVILLSPVVILGIDVILYFWGGNDSTISRMALRTSQKYPSFLWAVCFLFGLLCGHLFAPMAGDRQLPGYVSLPLFVGAPLLVAFADIVLQMKTEVRLLVAAGETSRDYPLVTVMILMIMGSVVGATLLPQTKP